MNEYGWWWMMIFVIKQKTYQCLQRPKKIYSHDAVNVSINHKIWYFQKIKIYIGHLFHVLNSIIRCMPIIGSKVHRFDHKIIIFFLRMPRISWKCFMSSWSSFCVHVDSLPLRFTRNSWIRKFYIWALELYTYIFFCKTKLMFLITWNVNLVKLDWHH